MDRARPTLNQLNIVSGNPDASIAFYRRLGVEIPEPQVWRTASGVHHVNGVAAAAAAPVRLELDSAALAAAWNAAWRGRKDLAGKVVIGFALDSRAAVDHLHAEMFAAGHPSLQAPIDAFWGARYAILADPDGVAVGLMSPISSGHRSPPPEV